MSGVTSQQSDGQAGRQIKRYLVVVITVVIALLFVRSCHKDKQNTKSAPPTSSGIQVGQSVEEWVLIWILKPGQTSRAGNNSLVLDVEVTKDDTKCFWAVLYDKDGHGMSVKVAGMRLDKIGEDLIGYWTSYTGDGDEGRVYLYKSPGGWTGHMETKSGRRPDCRLERRGQ